MDCISGWEALGYLWERVLASEVEGQALGQLSRVWVELVVMRPSSVNPPDRGNYLSVGNSFQCELPHNNTGWQKTEK